MFSLVETDKIKKEDETEKIKLEDLDASTVYHFRVSSADELGNQGVSGDYVFVTGGFQDIKDIQKNI